MLFRMLHIPLVLLFAGCALSAPEHVPADASNEHSRPSASEHSVPLAKRSPHYDFGLGKRAYSYVSEYKRLPVYNFGLGKRSRPYSFGLGKRSVTDDDIPDDDFVNDNELDQEALADIMDEYDEMGYPVKRARPYSFGLGKRDDAEEKRAKMYNFGLGKRVPLYNFGLGKRGKSYSFGLGKRLSKFNFGLGKRERDLHRFNFGLGKRSDYSLDDGESNDNDA